MVYLLFFYFSIVVIGLAYKVISAKNPVHGVLTMLALFFHMAGFYLLLNAEFLAAVQVIVYCGAILVLYLFVLFLVDIKSEVKTGPFIKNGAKLAILSSILLLLTFLRGVKNFSLGPHGHFAIERVQEITHTKAIGQEVFTTYILPFEIAGLILLVAVVGGIALAKREAEGKEG